MSIENIKLSKASDLENLIRKNSIALFAGKDFDKEKLKTIPNRLFLEMPIIYKIVMRLNGYDSAVLITNTMLDLIGMSEDELYHLAVHNTQVHMPFVIEKIGDMLNRMLGSGTIPVDDDKLDTPLYVLTNSENLYGAATILYDGLLEQIGDTMEDDFYLIPSSIHEVLLVPKRFADQPEYMTDIVRQVNDNVIDKNIILSYNLMVFERNRNRLTIIADIDS